MKPLRTFRGATTREALQRVKDALGPNAVILGTRTLPSGPLGRLVNGDSVEITAAASDDAPARAAGKLKRSPAPATPVQPAPPPAEAAREAPSVKRRPLRGVPDTLYPYYLRLVQQQVSEELAAEIAGKAAEIAGRDSLTEPNAVRAALRDAVSALVPARGGIQAQPGRPTRVVLVGPPGAGKTSTIAKLAAQQRLRAGRRVALWSFDMHRMATHDELRRYAELIGAEFDSAQTPAAVRALTRRAPQPDVALIDTPGVSARDRERFALLAALLEAARPDETHLVLPASMQGEVQDRAAAQFSTLGVDGVILTRLDELLGFGAVLGAIRRLSCGISYLCDGQSVPRDLREACPERLAELLFDA